MSKLLLPCLLFILLALIALACTSGSGIGIGGTPTPTGSADEEFILYFDTVSYWIDSHTAERKPTERLTDIADVLNQPHYVANSRVITSGGQFFPFDTMNGVVAPAGYRLAYVAEAGLYVQTISGADITLIAAGGREPLWHPTGETLAFRQGSALLLTSATGANQRQLLHGQSPRPLAWSPDGAQLLYQDGPALAIVTVASGQQRPLSIKANQLALPPQWWPDGQTLVAGSRGANGVKLVTIDTNSSQMADLIVWDKPIAGFSLSPSDGRIAFWAEVCHQQAGLFPWMRYEQCRNQLHVADSSGRHIREFDNYNNNMNNPPLLGWAVRPFPPTTIAQPAPTVAATDSGTDEGADVGTNGSPPVTVPDTIPAPLPTPPPALDGYSMSHPFAYGTIAQAGQWAYSVEEVLRGQAALDWLLAAGKTPRLQEGEEYLLLKTAVFAPAATDDQELELRLFNVTGSQRILYRPVSGLLEDFSEHNWSVPVGTTIENWLAFIIPEGESNLLFLLQTSSVDRPAFLALTPDAVVPQANNHQPDNNLGTTAASPVTFGEQLVADSWAVTILDAAQGEAAEAILIDNSRTYRPSDDGFTYSVVHLRLENVHLDDKPRWIEARRFELLDENGSHLVPDTIRLFLKQPLAAQLLPGGHLEAWVVWHVATPTDPNWRPATLYFEQNTVNRGHGRYLALP